MSGCRPYGPWCAVKVGFADCAHPIWCLPALRFWAARGRPKSEREGFEPSVRLPVHRISSAVPSAARTPLRAGTQALNTVSIKADARQARFYPSHGRHQGKSGPRAIHLSDVCFRRSVRRLLPKSRDLYLPPAAGAAAGPIKVTADTRRPKAVDLRSGW